MEDIREVNINVVGDRRMPVLRKLYKTAIDKVREAVKEMKSGKAPSLNRFPAYFLKFRIACETVEYKFCCYR